jgi:hypothetical protein
MPRLLVLCAAAVAVALTLGACSAPAPVTGGGDPTTDPVSTADLPGWYGTEFDADGCPVPVADADLEPFADAAAFLQADVPAGWCMYSTLSYLEYYAIPAVPDHGFGGDVRATLEPAGWEWDAIDDDSPQWSWLIVYPHGSQEGFEDDAVDGAIFTVDSATEEDLDTYQIWYMSLVHAFGGDWAEGDQIRVLGFW